MQEKSRNLVTLICAIIIGCSVNASAQTPYTQRLIRQEILRLEGEWEGDLPKRICFTGEKFASEHFEMLAHCTELDWLRFISISECKADDLKHLGNLQALRRIDFYESDCLLEGLKFLANCRSITEIRIESGAVDAKVLKSLANIRSLQKLTLDVTSLDDESFQVLSQLDQLKVLDLVTGEETVSDVANRKTLANKLPNCKIN